MDLSGSVVMDTGTYLVFFERSIKYVHLDVCYICLNDISTFFTLVNNIKQLCNLCWMTEYGSAQCFKHPFFTLEISNPNTLPKCSSCQDRAWLARNCVLLKGFYYEGPRHVLTTLQPTEKRRNQKPCFQARGDFFQDNVPKDTHRLKKSVRFSVHCDCFTLIVEAMEILQLQAPQVPHLPFLGSWCPTWRCCAPKMEGLSPSTCSKLILFASLPFH